MNFFFENLSLVPETRQVIMEHFKLVFGSGTSDLAKIRPLKVGPPAINWKSSLYENFHPEGRGGVFFSSSSLTRGP